MSKSQVQKSKARGDTAQFAGPKSKKMIALGIILISIVAIAGWFGWNIWSGTSEQGPQVGAAGPDVPLLDTVGTKLGEIAPDFTVPTLDGGNFTLAEQRGKVSIVFFMAYWCGTCVPEGQALALAGF